MTVSRTSSSVGELLVALDRTTRVPLHHQLEGALRDAIRAGRLREGSPLPSSRRLAGDLGLSRGVVVEAYEQLTEEGYLVSRPGGATRVAATSTPPPPRGSAPAPGAPLVDLRYGRPDVSQFPREAWLRSLRRALADVPTERLNYLDGRGAPELREALADYLNRVRGTWATPDHVVVCSGFAQGIALTVQVLAATGVRRLAVEDPSDDDGRRVAAAAGLEVVGIPVGDGGLDVAALEASDADAVLVTAAHQFPTGAVLAAPARAALLRWAERRGALVVEDDYDAEYRYDQAPVGAMQGLAPDHVLYAGSASKTLAPGLRLGWLVVPDRLVDAVAAAKLDLDRGSPVIDQLTFADFLVRGEFDRHLRRMRPVYRRRRDVLLSALADRLPDLQPAGVSAGIHLITWLPPDLDEDALVAAAVRRGVDIVGLRPYRVAAAGPGALLFGYGKTSERTLVAGVEAIADAVAELRGRASPGGSGGLPTITVP